MRAPASPRSQAQVQRGATLPRFATSFAHPSASFNLTVELLKEHRPWRQFARLPNRHAIPDASLLHDFRARLGVSGLRAINTYLLKPLLSPSNLGVKTVALIDSTDLPAATGNNYKKSAIRPTQPEVQPKVTVPSKAGKAAGLPATRSTPCAFGSMAIPGVCSWFHWSAGYHQPIAGIRTF